MTPCESYQANLLDRLYGLLGAQEAEALRRHLENCAACRSALASAEKQQAQLAAASKLAFPEVHFEAPDEGNVIGGGFLPFSSTGFRWAVAAGLLLVLGGLLGSGRLYSWRQQEVASAEKRLDELKLAAQKLDAQVVAVQRDFNQAQNELTALNEKFPRRIEQAHDALNDPKQLRLVLQGPKTPEAG